MKEDLKKEQEKNLNKQHIYSQSKEQNKVVKDAEEMKNRYSPYFYGSGS